MYRGSSFLLQEDYLVHHGVVSQLFNPRYESLWKAINFGGRLENFARLPFVWQMAAKNFRIRAVGRRPGVFGSEAEVKMREPAFSSPPVEAAGCERLVKPAAAR
jgi:hypothetical protein